MAQRRRKTESNTAYVSAEALADNDGRYGLYHGDSKTPGADFFLRPFNKGIGAGDAAISLFTEMFGTFVWVFLTLLVRSAQQTETNLTTAGVWIGLIAGLSYYLCAGFKMDGRMGNDELPKHLSWEVTFFYFLIQRTGALAAILYMVAQTAGAAVAGAVLVGVKQNFTLPGFANGTGPIPAPAQGPIIGFEILGTAIIILGMAFGHLAGTNFQEERDRIRTSHLYGAIARFVVTAAFWQFRVWVFEPLLYIAGSIATCGTVCTSTITSFGDATAAFYLLGPGAGVVGALLVFIFYKWAVGGPYAPQRKAKSESVESRATSRRDTGDLDIPLA